MKKILVTACLLLITLAAACGPINSPTPTVDAPGTFTAVAQTLSIGMPTFPAASETPPPPSATPSTPTGFPTIQVISSLTSTPPLYISWTPSTCDKSAFVSDITITDYMKMAPGTHFTKTWRIKNIGTCSWTKDYRFQYISGNPLGADTIYLTKTVAPGDTIDISLDMVAPTTPEDYSSFWRLRNKAGDIFGTTFFIAIEVTKTAATLTPSGTLPTATRTGTPPTSTPTKTPVTATSTNTVIPVTATNTNTSIPATATTEPPTATTAPPSDTPIPPTDTSVPVEATAADTATTPE